MSGFFKCYRQIERSDCGLSCIRMVAQHYGKEISHQYLQKITDLSRLGMSVRDVEQCLRKIGFKTASVKLKTEDVARMPLPAVLHWNGNHFVTLYSVSGSRNYYIADPAYGKLKYNEAEFTKHWIKEGSDSGIAIISDPSDSFYSQSFPQEDSLRNFFKHIFSYVSIFKGNFLKCLCISLFLIGFDFSVPILLQTTIDKGIATKDIGLVGILLLAQLSIAVGILISNSILSYIMARTGLSANLKMVMGFLKRFTSLPVPFYEKRASSDFVQKINDQSRIKDFLMKFPNTVFLIFLNLIAFSSLLIYYSPIIFCIFTLLSALEIGWSFVFLNSRKVLDLELFKYSSESRNHAYELTNGMIDLKANNGERQQISKWENVQKLQNEVSERLLRLNLWHDGGKSLISKFKDLSIIGAGAFLVIENGMSIGVLMTLGYITGRLSTPFSSISEQIKELQDAVLSYRRIEEVLNADEVKKELPTYVRSMIEIDNISFKYPGALSPKVVSGFSLTVNQGETIALVGESGCGKSTMIKLMLGFYSPQEGRMILGGNDSANMDGTDWLRHCGVVLQEGRIFSGTIIENIALSDDSPNIERITELIKIVGLTEYVNTLPMKLNTKIGVWGVEMSGGQKQRLMIARALYKQPDILFLDEATSSLDANNEKAIVEKLRDYGKGRTIVIAAHRLSTIRHADKIVFMREGRVIEEGTHEELMALGGGEYRRLFQNQIESAV